jgi:hypothetical protein
MSKTPDGFPRIRPREIALTFRLQSFETELLTQEANLAGLAALNRALTVAIRGIR